MTQPVNTTKEQDALKGWNHLTQVLGVWIPARLKLTHRATTGMRQLRSRG